jgi:hypothetical protein
MEILSSILTVLLAFLIGLILALALFFRRLFKGAPTIQEFLRFVQDARTVYGYSSEFHYEIHRFISETERRYSIRLSGDARQLLILPLIELRRLSFQNERNARIFPPELDQDWRRSIESIIETIRENPAGIDQEFIQRETSSLSVIKAYAKRWCNIPPFCSEK